MNCVRGSAGDLDEKKVYFFYSDPISFLIYMPSCITSIHRCRCLTVPNTVIIHVLRLEESRHTLELEVAARGQEFGQLVVRVRAAEARNLECEETIKRLEEARDDAEARVRSVGAALQSVTSRPATPSRCLNFSF